MTTLTEPIAIAPGSVGVSLDLRRSTTLASCTHLDMHPETGQPIVVRNFERLSSGEELLWSLLAWLSGHADMPAVEDLQAGLDSAHWATVRGLLWSEGIPC